MEWRLRDGDLHGYEYCYSYSSYYFEYYYHHHYYCYYHYYAFLGGGLAGWLAVLAGELAGIGGLLIGGRLRVGTTSHSSQAMLMWALALTGVPLSQPPF